MQLPPYKIVFVLAFILFGCIFHLMNIRALFRLNVFLSGFIRCWSLMMGSEAAGSVLMGTTGDGESLNLILCP